MQWKTPGDSKAYIYTEEGYAISRVWSGSDWVYMSWGPPIYVLETGAKKPNLLIIAIDEVEHAKQTCECHYASRHD